MKLLVSNIDKNLELGEEHLLNKSYKKFIYRSILAYDMALAFLDQKDPKGSLKNKLWMRLVRSPNRVDVKPFQKIQMIISSDSILVHKSIKEMTDAIQQKGFDYGDIFKNTPSIASIGVRSMEMPENV